MIEQKIDELITSTRKYTATVRGYSLYMNQNTLVKLGKEMSDSGYHFGEKFKGIPLKINNDLPDDVIYFMKKPKFKKIGG
jgi:hypothetical protein